MNVPTAVLAFWREFERSLGSEASDRFYEASYFADSEASANALADLVLEGTKRATASLVWGLEFDRKAAPRPGDLSVVTRWDGRPVCVIETQVVETIAFDNVSEGFAATEGEGDKSLRYWREAHWAYYGRECKRIGRVPTLRMPILCEQFSVVYPPRNRG